MHKCTGGEGGGECGKQEWIIGRSLAFRPACTTGEENSRRLPVLSRGERLLGYGEAVVLWATIMKVSTRE